MKWFDANGTDVDAYPERAFSGGVYDGGVLGKALTVTGSYGRVVLGPEPRPTRLDLLREVRDLR